MLTPPRTLHAPSDESAGARLRRHLQVIECRYARVWDQLDSLRSSYTLGGLWPAWGHVPLAHVHEVISPGQAMGDPTRLVDVAIVAGLACWRSHQGICPSERTARAIDQPPDLDITSEHLITLLDHPIFIELPESSLGSPATGATRGVLAHLAYEDVARVAELRLLIEPTRRWTLGSVPLLPLAVPLTEPTLARALDAIVREHVRHRDRLARYAVAGEMAVALHGLVRVCAGLVVHLLDPSGPLAANEPPADAEADAHLSPSIA